jgi:hypothetical protein
MTFLPETLIVVFVLSIVLCSTSLLVLWRIYGVKINYILFYSILFCSVLFCSAVLCSLLNTTAQGNCILMACSRVHVMLCCAGCILRGGLLYPCFRINSEWNRTHRIIRESRRRNKPIYLPVRLRVHVTAFPSVCLSNYLSIRLFMHPHVCPSLSVSSHLSMCPCISIDLSVSLSQVGDNKMSVANETSTNRISTVFTSREKVWSIQTSCQHCSVLLSMAGRSWATGTFLSVCQEFFFNTGIHGLKYVTEAGRRNIERWLKK